MGGTRSLEVAGAWDTGGVEKGHGTRAAWTRDTPCMLHFSHVLAVCPGLEWLFLKKRAAGLHLLGVVRARGLKLEAQALPLASYVALGPSPNLGFLPRRRSRDTFSPQTSPVRTRRDRLAVPTVGRRPQSPLQVGLVPVSVLAPAPRPLHQPQPLPACLLPADFSGLGVASSLPAGFLGLLI